MFHSKQKAVREDSLFELKNKDGRDKSNLYRLFLFRFNIPTIHHLSFMHLPLALHPCRNLHILPLLHHKDTAGHSHQVQPYQHEPSFNYNIYWLLLAVGLPDFLQTSTHCRVIPMLQSVRSILSDESNPILF